MVNEQSENSKEKKNNADAAVKPDAETLNTTDPQDQMEGPLSSLAKKTTEGIEDEDDNKSNKSEAESE